MYHHQGSSHLLSSRTAFPLERHLYLQRGNVPGDSGLVLSTDAKPRLKWTLELHERFREAVNQLGGPEKATPKTIMRLMGIPGLTLYHLKSHLQKYRLSKNLRSQANTGTGMNGCTLGADRMCEEIGPPMSNMSCRSQTNESMHISEALQAQIEVQRRLHEQLEVQRHLQLRIEAQGKYLQSVLEKAQETLEKQNSGSPGLEAVKAQLSRLVPKVSNESLAFPCLQDFSGLRSLQEQTSQLAHCSKETCLTSYGGSQKDQEVHDIRLGLKTNHGYSPVCTQPLREDTQLQQAQPEAFGQVNNCKNFASSTVRDSDRTVFPVLSMSVNAQMEKGISSHVLGEWKKERDDEETYLEQQYSKRLTVQHEKEKKSDGSELPWLTARLDLNGHEDNYAAPPCKKLDLNGFSCY